MDGRWSVTLQPGTWATERTLGRLDAHFYTQTQTLLINQDNLLLNAKLKVINGNKPIFNERK